MFDKLDVLTEARATSPDDHVGGYTLSRRLIGLYSFDSTLVVIFFCKSNEQQSMFGEVVGFTTKIHPKNQFYTPGVSMAVDPHRLKASKTTVSDNEN